MDMARKGFVENGDAFFGRHRQTYLDQGIALAVLLVVTQATQQAALPVEVGVGDIVDHSSRFQTRKARVFSKIERCTAMASNLSRASSAPTKRRSVRSCRFRMTFRSVRSNQCSIRFKLL